MIPLFEIYPRLRDRLPYTSLGEFPTPVQRLEGLGMDLGISHLYVKRDDLSGKAYGGNKTRKLEFLLGKAIEAKAREVMTFAAVGSNHALATAIYTKQLGLKCISMLVPQPNAHYVRSNLLMSLQSGAEMHPCGALVESRMNIPLVRMEAIRQMLRHRIGGGHFPLIIPPGGSSPLGTIGYVNAAYELKEQIAKGELPDPDYIYVASATMGTASGLMLGLKTAELRARVITVPVIYERYVSLAGMMRLAKKANSLLHSIDDSYPSLGFHDRDFDIRHGFCGERYALFTREGVEAVKLMEVREGLELDGTYTGKALAALMYDAKEGYLRDKVVMFWNTLNSRDFSDTTSTVDYRNLPREFHRYFEEEVQPLDMRSRL